ncbi:MAG: hypothetical protein KC933_31100, partial [Myxococcales bacterium]|nr:hypothetical protein [Myxococcales bacterium]
SGSGPGLAWATSGAAGLRARALFGAPRPAAEHVFLSESRTTELVWEQGEGQVPTEAGANLSVLTEKPLGKAALSKLADHVARHHGEVEIMVVEPESVATLRRLDDGTLVTDSPAVKAALGDRVRVHARATDMQGVLRALEGGAELVELTGAPDAADLAGLFEGHGKVELRWSDGARTGKLAVGANGKAQLTAPPELAAGLTERLLWAERPFRLAVEGQGTVSSVPTQTRLRGSLATIAPLLEVVCTHRALAGRVAGPDAPIARLMKGSLHSAMDHVRKATVGDIPEAWKASSEPWLEAAEGMARFQANDRAGNLAHALEAIEARSELPDTVVAQGLAGQAKGWNSVALVRLFGEGTAATQRRILQDLRDNFSPTGRVALRGAFLDVVWRADKQDAGLSAAHEKRVLGSLLTRANDRLTASSVVAIPADRTGSNARTKTPDFLVQEFGAGDSVEVSRWTEAKSWHWPYLGNRAQELATGIAQLQGHKLRSPGTNTFELSIDLYGTSATVATKERAVRALAPSAFAPHGNISLVVW